MARQRSAFYDTIEYIGPRPEKPKRPNIFGGWVILVIAAGIGFFFGRPLIPFLKAAQSGTSAQEANQVISSLESSHNLGDRLASSALVSYSSAPVTYDDTYRTIDYPNGDIPLNRGKAEDVIIRCYRQLGIDLQQRVHDDMEANFRLYPQLWQATGPDTNIDHRRAPNLQRFFSRNGDEILDENNRPSREAEDYQPGDIVTWALPNGDPHIGIVVPCPLDRGKHPWVVHHLDSGVKWENVLFDYQITGHYRYPAKNSPAE